MFRIEVFNILFHLVSGPRMVYGEGLGEIPTSYRVFHLLQQVDPQGEPMGLEVGEVVWLLLTLC